MLINRNNVGLAPQLCLYSTCLDLVLAPGHHAAERAAAAHLPRMCRASGREIVGNGLNMGEI